MARAYSALSCATRSPSTSLPHVTAIRLPEPAHRGFGGPRLLRLRALAPHVDHRHLISRRGDASLDETPDAAVLHGDVAGGADQVGLLEAAAAHVVGVVGEAEVGPVQLHAPHALRHHLPHRQAVVDLLEHEAGEHGEDLQLDPVAPLVHRVEPTRVDQAIAVLLGADALLAVGGAGAV